MKRLVALLLLILLQAWPASAATWNRDSLTGGSEGSLDSISSIDARLDIAGLQPLTAKDTAITKSGGVIYYHTFDPASTAAENEPSVIAPDDIGVNPGRWLRIPPFLLSADITNLAATISANTAVSTAYTHSQSAHAPATAEQNVQADWAAPPGGDDYIANKPVIPSSTSQLTNDSGFITGYAVTQGDVTAHQAALTITESQITNLAHTVDTVLTEAQVDAYANNNGYAAATDVSLNTTHRTSSGSDHTWLDQDLRTTASPTFAGITINGADGNRAVSLLDNTVAVSCLAGDYRIYPQNGVWKKCENGVITDVGDMLQSTYDANTDNLIDDTAIATSITRDSEIPTAVSQLTNDAHYIQLSSYATNVANSWTFSTGSVTPGGYMRDMTYAPELALFVAVGDDTIYTSTDGDVWTARTPPAIHNWQSITWSAELGRLCAVGSTAGVMTSPDGITWTSRTPAGLWSTIYGVEWAPELGLFTATGVTDAYDGAIMTSPDGVTWTSRTPASLDYWLTIAWSPELHLFAVATTNAIMTSPDGVTWISRTSALTTATFDLEWCPGLGLFVGVGSAGGVQTSPDGITWTARTAASADNWQSVAWSAELNLLIAASDTTTMSSIDGITWVPGPASGASTMYGLTWNPDLAIFASAGAVGGDSAFAYTLSPYALAGGSSAVSTPMSAAVYDADGDGKIDDVAIAATIARDSEIPTAVSALTNDSGYISGYTETDPNAEPALGNPGIDGYILSSTAAGTRSWIPDGGSVDLTAPGPIGSVTPNTGAFTDLIADTFDWGTPATGTTGEMALLEDPANGTNSTTLKAAADIAADVVLTLPGVYGVDGQVWTTNATGTMGWSDAVLDSDIGVTVQAYDADLADLADGSLSGSKVGTGLNGTNITTGTVPDAYIDAAIARDAEITTHAAVTTSVHGITDTSTLLTSESDPTVDTSAEIVTIINTSPSTLISESLIPDSITRDNEVTKYQVAVPATNAETCTLSTISGNSSGSIFVCAMGLLTNTADISFVASTKTISSQMMAIGERSIIGAPFKIVGSAGNDGQYTVASIVSPTTITVVETVVDESAGATISVILPRWSQISGVYNW